MNALLTGEIDRILNARSIPHSFHGKGLFFSVAFPGDMVPELYNAFRANRILTGGTKSRLALRTPLVLTEKDAAWFCDVLGKILPD